MKYGKMILIAGLAGLALGLYISASITFLVLLIGLLIVPPIAAIVSTIKEGVPILLKESARHSQDKENSQSLPTCQG
ncbi:MAG: hypothetical protein C3F06_03640 [Candidatus Methanoperedenaceae archaeon]|nr:MAG: hypothetical protein C3F06_03640 [Candidatus Methanoperedenaceae archaeon]